MKYSFSLLITGLLIALAPMVCAAQDTSLPETGSGTVIDVWAVRAGRAADFRNQMTAFALQRSAAWNKWQIFRNKFTDHIDRCHTQIRAANRDTLLPVTQQCFRGQLVIERDALKRNRTVYEKMPGLTDVIRSALLQKNDALVGALQTIIDGVDARVFATMAQLKDVRANLLEQYRQPYWIAVTQARADELLTWTAHLLTALKESSADTSLPAPALANVTEAMTCLEGAEASFAIALAEEDTAAARQALAEGIAAARTCTTLIREAQSLQAEPAS